MFSGRQGAGSHYSLEKNDAKNEEMSDEMTEMKVCWTAFRSYEFLPPNDYAYGVNCKSRGMLEDLHCKKWISFRFVSNSVKSSE